MFHPNAVVLMTIAVIVSILGLIWMAYLAGKQHGKTCQCCDGELDCRFCRTICHKDHDKKHKKKRDREHL